MYSSRQGDRDNIMHAQVDDFSFYHIKNIFIFLMCHTTVQVLICSNVFVFKIFAVLCLQIFGLQNMKFFV